MKLKRIANNAALQTIGYLIGGAQRVSVETTTDGFTGHQIFFGLFRDFFTQMTETYSHYAVMYLKAADGVIHIGIEE